MMVHCFHTALFNVSLPGIVLFDVGLCVVTLFNVSLFDIVKWFNVAVF